MTQMNSQRPNPQDRLSSLGRGVFALKNFEPCRRPGKTENVTRSGSSAGGTTTLQKKADQPQAAAVTVKANGFATKETQPVATKPPTMTTKQPVFDKDNATELFCKYNYKANPDRPGGFDELSFKQSERLWLVKRHPSNEHWLEAANEDGDIGFVPATYMKIIEKKLTNLPWLQKKESLDFKSPETEKKKESGNRGSIFGKPPVNVVAAKQPVKAYIPTYTANTKVTENPSNVQYYCSICDKQLNGPLPYKAHMVSKYHKEEEEAQRLYGR